MATSVVSTGYSHRTSQRATISRQYTRRSRIPMRQSEVREQVASRVQPNESWRDRFRSFLRLLGRSSMDKTPAVVAGLLKRGMQKLRELMGENPNDLASRATGTTRP